MHEQLLHLLIYYRINQYIHSNYYTVKSPSVNVSTLITINVIPYNTNCSYVVLSNIA